MKDWMALFVFMISIFNGIITISYSFEFEIELMYYVGITILVLAGIFCGRWIYEDREEDV